MAGNGKKRFLLNLFLCRSFPAFLFVATISKTHPALFGHAPGGADFFAFEVAFFQRGYDVGLADTERLCDVGGAEHSGMPPPEITGGTPEPAGPPDGVVWEAFMAAIICWPIARPATEAGGSAGHAGAFATTYGHAFGHLDFT